MVNMEHLGESCTIANFRHCENTHKIFQSIRSEQWIPSERTDQNWSKVFLHSFKLIRSNKETMCYALPRRKVSSEYA